MKQNDKVMRREFKAKSANQELYLRAMRECDMVFCTGPAGSGKTACAIGYAVKQYLDGEFDHIVITRPTVGVDEEEGDRGLGYLPGEINQKMDPFVRPVMDELRTYFGQDLLEKLIYKLDIEIVPLYYMRGRNLHNSFVICDEGQNASYKQLKSLSTRLGRASKLVVNGDIQQHDKIGECGLIEFMDNIVSEIDDIAICELQVCDIVRHPLVKKIVEKTDEYEKRKKANAKNNKSDNTEHFSRGSVDYTRLFK